MSPALILAIAAVVLAPLITYIGVTRKLSGKITTSEASDLWAASDKLRGDYRADNDQLRVRLGAAEERIARMESDAELLRRANRTLEETCNRLTAELEAVKATNVKLLERIDELEEAVRVATAAKEQAERKAADD